MSIKAAAPSHLPDADRSQGQQRPAVGGLRASAATGSVQVGDRATQGSAQLEGGEIAVSAALEPLLALGTKHVRMSDTDAIISRAAADTTAVVAADAPTAAQVCK